MPKQFTIEQGGANRKLVNEIATEFMGLRVTRDRQAVLVFDPEEGAVSTLTRISSENGKQDKQAVKRQIKSLLGQAGTVMVGLVEGSDAPEHRMPSAEPGKAGRSSRFGRREPRLYRPV